MNALTELSPSALRKAADLQEQILELKNQLNQLLGEGAIVETATIETPEALKKRKFSAASIAKMRKAQKERWARIKGTTAEPVLEAP